jgi:hypothetical protein
VNDVSVRQGGGLSGAHARNTRATGGRPLPPTAHRDPTTTTTTHTHDGLTPQEPKACSIVLRGASKDVLNEVERNLHVSLVSIKIASGWLWLVVRGERLAARSATLHASLGANDGAWFTCFSACFLLVFWGCGCG